MKKHIASIALGAAAIAGLIYASVPAKHVGPAYLYPDPQYTIGVAATLSSADLTATYPCQKGTCTYSQAHRDVSSGSKSLIASEYPTTTPKTAGAFEIDHFYPLCAGGSNDAKNLWLQPAHSYWNGQDFGFHTKDKLESWGCTQIKASRLDPHVFFDGVTGDWVAFYIKNRAAIESGSPIDDTVE